MCVYPRLPRPLFVRKLSLSLSLFPCFPCVRTGENRGVRSYSRFGKWGWRSREIVSRFQQGGEFVSFVTRISWHLASFSRLIFREFRKFISQFRLLKARRENGKIFPLWKRSSMPCECTENEMLRLRSLDTNWRINLFDSLSNATVSQRREDPCAGHMIGAIMVHVGFLAGAQQLGALYSKPGESRAGERGRLSATEPRDLARLGLASKLVIAASAWRGAPIKKGEGAVMPWRYEVTNHGAG